MKRSRITIYTESPRHRFSLSDSVDFFDHRSFLIFQLFMCLLPGEQPCRKAMLEVTLTFLALGNNLLQPEILHQSIPNPKRMVLEGVELVQLDIDNLFLATAGRFFGRLRGALPVP